ncbi:MAG: hypothetical protein IPP32_13875 [Bacteroidetes bacterium]|nr:hypothetical protein [Bacteroidota bacterium]
MSKTSTLKKTNSISAHSKSENTHSFEGQEPSNSVIQAILNYSKALSVQASKNIKHVELILN